MFDQFSFPTALRQCNDNISQVQGFVFPKLTSKKMVTLLTVYWEDLEFRSKYRMLALNDVSSSIIEVLQKQINFPLPGNLPQSFNTYFMKLNQTELSLLSRQMDSGVLKQVKSQSSILVKDQSHYYKLVSINRQAKNLSDMYILYIYEHERELSRIDHLSLPINSVRVYGAEFFQFESHPYQLRDPKQLRKCMFKFVQQARDALRSLHNLGYAHTDVRLHNICFSKDYVLKPIDFDDVVYNKKRMSNTRSGFYSAPYSNCIAESLDFKQLGFIILYILNCDSCENSPLVNYLDSDFTEKYPFLSGLINQGYFDDSEFEDWKIVHADSRSLEDTLLVSQSDNAEPENDLT